MTLQSFENNQSNLGPSNMGLCAREQYVSYIMKLLAVGQIKKYPPLPVALLRKKTNSKHCHVLATFQTTSSEL
jgi:hypothetical protein